MKNKIKLTNFLESKAPIWEYSIGNRARNTDVRLGVRMPVAYPFIVVVVNSINSNLRNKY